MHYHNQNQNHQNYPNYLILFNIIIIITFLLTTIVSINDAQVTHLTVSSSSSSSSTTNNNTSSSSSPGVANDEEASINANAGGGGGSPETPHILDRHLLTLLYPNSEPTPVENNGDGGNGGNGGGITITINGSVSNGTFLSSSSSSSSATTDTESFTQYPYRNCTYSYHDVFCDCSIVTRRFSCYQVQSVADIKRAFEHLLNTTRLIYWSTLEIHCVEPLPRDDPTAIDANSGGGEKPELLKSFHITYEMFVDGPKFESVEFFGDCAKPKHYDNLITVDREVQRLAMVGNMLRMATSCSLLQPKFERLQELTLRDCMVAGDMISSTFSTRCLGQYGTRNEPMQLTKLTITGCNISLVENGAFYNFAELELIDLSRNQISHLSRQSFAPHLYRLRTLKLDHNRLTSLGGEFFEKLPELREVLLSDNRLTILPMLPQSAPGVAQVLHLGNNPWDCRCRMTWLLDESLDSMRIVVDVPRCGTPVTVKNFELNKGLHVVLDTFC